MGPLDSRALDFTHPFNSTLETGVRALVLLEALHPRRCDLLEMTWLDHLVVHTGDFGLESPSSLHPDLPNRAGELLVRRQLVEKGLQLMQQIHLVDVFETADGFTYGASDEVPSYLDVLQSSYSMELKERARWVAEQFGDLGTAQIRSVVEERMGRWTAEFRHEQFSTRSST